MDERFHAWQHEVEDWHWWYRVRREILDRMLDQLGLDPATARLLDVGCGTGGGSLVLAKHGAVTGVDRALESFRLAPERPYRHRVVAEIDRRLPFADDSFDVVCALDVLEHLDDDRAGAREIARVCKPGGTVIAFVPAFQILWGYNDVFSEHRRRYVRAQLVGILEETGLHAVDSGYFNGMLFLPMLAARLLQRALPRMTEGMEHPTRRSPFNEVLTQLFRLEVPLVTRRHGLPVGGSTYCVARK
jgi:SAM-dependent methyltransferase